MASPLFDLTGKVAIITGSSKGIGKSIAEQLALQGAKVVISSRKVPNCEEVAAGIRKAGGAAIAVGCNISDKAQLEKLVTEIRQAFGPIDIVVPRRTPITGPPKRCRTRPSPRSCRTIFCPTSG